MGTNDDNARQQAGDLPPDPFADAEPFDGKPKVPWPDPIPLTPISAPPPFPLEVLSEGLRTWAQAHATALQCPVDLPACLVLCVIALAAAKKFAVRIAESWLCTLNLYLVVGLGSGESKSPAYRAALAPVHHHARNEARRVKQEQEKVEARSKALLQQIDAIIKRASRQDDEEKEAELLKKAERLKKRWSDLQVEPADQLLGEDATAEAVAKLLGSNNGRIGIFSDEGGPFAIMGGRYSDKPNFEVYLKGHDGGDYIVNRKGSPPVHVHAATLTMALTVQPHVINSLGRESDFRGKGLLARFMYSMPHGRIGTRKGELQADPGQQQRAYHAKMLRLLEVPLDRDEEGVLRPRPIPVDAEAEAVFIEFRNRIEPQLSPFGELGFMADWGSKIRGDVMRLAGLLHLGDFLQGDIPNAQVPIPASTLRRAVALADYFLVHTQIAFDLMGADQRLLDARHVERWLAHHWAPTITKRDLHQGVRGRQSLKTIEQLDELLPLLLEHHILRVAGSDAESKRPGRPAGPTYEVNPALATPRPATTQPSATPTVAQMGAEKASPTASLGGAPEAAS